MKSTIIEKGYLPLSVFIIWSKKSRISKLKLTSVIPGITEILNKESLNELDARRSLLGDEA